MTEFSQETTELFKALAEFQKNVEQPKKDADNPFFKSKYVPLENVVDAIHEEGSKHGLSEITYPASDDNAVGVGVIITHSSGQYMKLPPVLLKPDKNTPQGVGAAITYARRYALSSAFGIASETDDDANSISGNDTNKPNQNQQQSKPKKQTKIQREKFDKLINESMELKNIEGAQAKQKLINWALQQIGQGDKSLQDINYNELDKAIKQVEGYKTKVQSEQSEK